MKKNIVIIHYNTPDLTECLVRSINLFVKDAVIYIFDNSTDKPFIAKFDNVTVFDNTKGQIIDFNKWLEKYPNKIQSHGRVNKWASAKHSYSVEKCMELIDDNFILLDSDVLLKRDISNLFIDDSIYVGNVIVQPNSSIKRVLPFICFINVKMCKEKGVHYFDDNYMHGLWKKNGADRYDTGAALYIHSVKYKHIEIDYKEYVIHYGHGSWKKLGESPKYSPTEWLRINKKYWSMDKNKKVIYTCIVGGYDTLLDPKIISNGFDYVCFTDNQNLSSNVWDIRPLPKETEELPKVKKQRYMKINPHKHLSEYELSIWVDGNVEIRGDLNKFINETLKNDCSVYVPKHPSRNCIYAEERVVIRMKKDKFDITNPQIKRYEKEGFPKDYGLLQSNILLRKHNDDGCIRLMEDWFEEVKNGSHRDQLSFNYVSWKNKDVNVTYLDKNICKSKYFFWKGSHSRQTFNKDDVPKKATQRKTFKEMKEEFYKMVGNKKIETHNVALYE